MTHDVQATATDLVDLAERLSKLLAGPAPPALVIARALLALDKARADLAAAVQAVADAQSR